MSHLPDIGYLLHHFSFTLDRQSDQILQERLGIGLAQFKILMVLKQCGNVSQRSIADFLGQTEASISRQTKLMHDKGLLQSTVSEHSRRERVTTLTHKGLRLLEAAYEALNSYHRPVFEALSGKQQGQFVEMLQAMHRQACRSDRPGHCQQSCEG
jgi:DNA-binding MarR family transcriptional regulator